MFNSFVSVISIESSNSISSVKLILVFPGDESLFLSLFSFFSFFNIILPIINKRSFKIIGNTSLLNLFQVILDVSINNANIVVLELIILY